MPSWHLSRRSEDGKQLVIDYLGHSDCEWHIHDCIPTIMRLTFLRLNDTQRLRVVPSNSRPFEGLYSAGLPDSPSEAGGKACRRWL